MKKYFSFLLLLGAVFLMSNCELGLGDTGEEIPENLFADGEWERVEYKWYTNTEYGSPDYGKVIETDEILYYKKLSFTQTEFVFYDKSNYKGSEYENTYTGTYSLFFSSAPDSGKREMIKFVSPEPIMNGNLFYSFNTPISPTVSVWFLGGTEIQNNFPVGTSGVYTKVFR